MKIDGEEYNFEPVSDANVAKNYNGFISDDGDFFCVSEKSKHTPTHVDWADEYLMLKRKSMSDKESKKCLLEQISFKGAQEYLINKFGYIYYSHSSIDPKRPIIVLPKSSLFKKVNPSEKQKNMLFKIMMANDELSDYPYDMYQAEKNQEHERYVDSLIMRQIDYNNKGETSNENKNR